MTRELLLAVLAALVSAWTWFSHREVPGDDVLRLPLELVDAEGRPSVRIVETDGSVTFALLDANGERTRMHVDADGTASFEVGDGLVATVAPDAARLEVRSGMGRVVHEANDTELRVLLEEDGGSALALRLTPAAGEAVLERRIDGSWVAEPVAPEVVALPHAHLQPFE